MISTKPILNELIYKGKDYNLPLALLLEYGSRRIKATLNRTITLEEQNYIKMKYEEICK